MPDIPSSPRKNQRLISWIMVALVLWGIYLAIGVTGIFLQRSLMDARKSVVVFVCVGLFLGLWSLALWRPRWHLSKFSSANHQTSAGRTRDPPDWSTPGLASAGLSVLGIAVWTWAAVSWRNVTPSMTTVLGWLAAGLLLGGATAGIISLSDRRPRHGKWLGCTSLLVLFGAAIVFVVRMSP